MHVLALWLWFLAKQVIQSGRSPLIINGSSFMGLLHSKHLKHSLWYFFWLCNMKRPSSLCSQYVHFNLSQTDDIMSLSLYFFYSFIILLFCFVVCCLCSFFVVVVVVGWWYCYYVLWWNKWYFFLLTLCEGLYIEEEKTECLLMFSPFKFKILI